MLRMRKYLCVSVLAVVATVPAVAMVSMPAIFGDHMVLQGGEKIPVWGTASPGESIRVTLGTKHAETKADAQGSWRVMLKAEISDEATILTVKGTNEITFTDVLIGDVWLASGQSNMEFGIKSANNGPALAKKANNPSIRLFTVPRFTGLEPRTEINPERAAEQGKWLVCTPESIAPTGAGFSAIAYLFARDIQQFTGKPVGIISSSWGGTAAESWISVDGLGRDAVLQRFVKRHAEIVAAYPAAKAAYPKELATYKAKDEEWKHVTRPASDAMLKRWQEQSTAAKAAGQPAPPRPATEPEPEVPDPEGGPHAPAALFNGMIAPIAPYGLKGVIWYQGESNGTRGGGVEYRTLLPRLIADWRGHWGEAELPFIYVQLPNYNNDWNLLREAQLRTLAVPATGMAITIDLGTPQNIHPPYKEPVAERLALVAEHVAYGRDLVYSGPLYRSMQVEGSSIRISFANVGSGLTIATTPISGWDVTPAPTDRLLTFTIAGSDKHWYPADAKIDGDSVVVTSDKVASPVAVRYGWAVTPVCNLYNKEQLPASPFRTDDWQ